MSLVFFFITTGFQLSIDENYYNLDTRAALLYKLENYEEASIAADKALSVGRMGGHEIEGTEELIRLINEKMGK